MQHNNKYRIGVITNSSGPSMLDLTKAAKIAGVCFEQITYTTINLLDIESTELFLKCLKYDVIYYRTALRDTVLDTLTKKLKERNIQVINSGAPNNRPHRKIQQALIIGNSGINQPKTIVTSTPTYELLASTLGERFVMKPDYGSKGAHVSLISSQSDIDFVLKNSQKEHFLYQAFLSNAVEYRVYTLGNEAVASYKKIASGHDFRANLHAGGTMGPTEPDITDSLYAFGSKIAAAFGADIAGIDVLYKDGQFFFLELNWQPGWENLSVVDGVDFSKRTIQYILDKTHARQSTT